MSYYKKQGSGANYTNFGIEGHQTMLADARCWRDELSDATSLQQSGTGVSRNLAENEVEFIHSATYNATFSSADAIVANVQLNHDKDLTASLYPHIHWVQEKDYVPNFLLQYRWQKNGGLQTTAWTFLPCISLAFAYTAATSLNQIAYSAAIEVPSGTNLSDIVQFRIYRDTGNASGEFAVTTPADPYNTGGNATVGITAFDCHFMINSLGSNDEFTK